MNAEPPGIPREIFLSATHKVAEIRGRGSRWRDYSPHFHKCEEVVLAGNGEIAIEGHTMRVQADCTLVLPAGQVHQVTNTGSVTIRLAAWL